MAWAVGLNAMPVEAACDEHAFADLLASLVPSGWWRLDETVGTVAVDSSGNGHHGTYQTGVRLADRPGPCNDFYLNCVPVGSAVVVPDVAAWSYPNDLTAVAIVAFENPFTSGGVVTGMFSQSKSDEWGTSHADLDVFVFTISTPPPDGLPYRSRVDDTQLLGIEWALVISRFPAADTPPTVEINHVNIVGSTTGPNGTRRSGTTSILSLGGGPAAVASPSPTRGRFLAHCALFDRLLTSGEADDLYAAAVADGWLPTPGVTTFLDSGDVTNPRDVAVNRFDGTVYVLNDSGNEVVTVDATGAVVATHAISSVYNLLMFAADINGSVYVPAYQGTLIYKVTAAGAQTIFAGATTAGTADGTGTAARFSYITDITIDSGGNLYVTDYQSGTGKIRKITPAGVVTTLAYTTAGIFGQITVDADGNLFVTEQAAPDTNIVKVPPSGSPSTLATFTSPSRIILEAFGLDVYVAVNTPVTTPTDAYIVKITPDLTQTTLTGADFDYIDGTLAAARFTAINGLAVRAGVLHVTELSSPSRVRKIIL